MEGRLMRILLTGHGCAPDMGSEPGVTWNWALHLAQRNDVWVITHGHFRPAIERYLAAHPVPRLRFVYTEKLGWWDPLRLPSQRGIRVHYFFWLRHVLKLARRLDAEHRFDLVHHVSWNTVSSPPLLWKLGKPSVWGPVGGGQTTDPAFLGLFARALPGELLRTLRVWMVPFLPGVRAAAARSSAVFAANRETAAILRKAGANDPPLLLDCGVPEHLLDTPATPRPTSGPFTILWVGRIEPRKGLPLCLEAVHAANVDGLRLIVVGEGPEAEAAREQASKLGLGDRVAFLGQRPWADVQALQRSAHAFLFSSVRDTSGNAAIEALAAGVPVICIDHQGMGSHLPDSAAIKVPVLSRGETVAAMARAIETLASDPARLARMSIAARAYAESEAWSRRAVAMQAHYAAIVGRAQGAADLAPIITA